MCVVAYIILVALCCSLPFFGMIFGWGAKSTENRAMTALPDLYAVTEDTIAPNLAFTEELGEYYSDHFGFRQELVTADSWLNENFFGRSSNSRVTVGRDGWFFLSQTADDYTGSSDLSERGIYRLSRTLDLMNRYCADANITFLFFVAPNKNSVYPQYMPWNIRVSPTAGNLDRLTGAMRAKLYYLDVKSVLVKKAAEKSGNLYLKNDSHWNNIGALAAYNAIQDNLNCRVRNYDYLPIDQSKLYISQYLVTGDLTAMLYPAAQKKDVQYDLGLPRSFSSSKPLNNLMDSEINTTCQGRYYSLMCYRDSFFNALIPITSNAFVKARYSRYSRTSPYDLTAARTGDYNIVIAEIAERNLPDILCSAPLMDAPGVNPPKAGKRCYAEQRGSFVDDGESFIFNGKIGDWAELDTKSNIYIELRSSSDQSFYYEAFPILSGDSYADDGFSARVSKYNLKNDEYQVFLHIGNGELTRYTELLLN
jgi:hypothetical protein